MGDGLERETGWGGRGLGEKDGFGDGDGLGKGDGFGEGEEFGEEGDGLVGT